MKQRIRKLINEYRTNGELKSRVRLYSGALLNAVFAVFKRTGITDGENATALDYGDALLKAGTISQDEHEKKLIQAKQILSAR